MDSSQDAFTQDEAVGLYLGAFCMGNQRWQRRNRVDAIVDQQFAGHGQLADIRGNECVAILVDCGHAKSAAGVFAGPQCLAFALNQTWHWRQVFEQVAG